jgi:hypothetical protein
MGMSIDEAIKHAEEVGNGCNECAAEHRQLAEWLKELKRYRQAKDGLLEDMKSLNCGFPFGLDYLISCIKKRLQEVTDGKID